MRTKKRCVFTGEEQISKRRHPFLFNNSANLEQMLLLWSDACRLRYCASVTPMSSCYPTLQQLALQVAQTAHAAGVNHRTRVPNLITNTTTTIIATATTTLLTYSLTFFLSSLRLNLWRPHHHRHGRTSGSFS